MGSENETLKKKIQDEKVKVDELIQENEYKMTEKKQLTEVIEGLKNLFTKEKENWLKKEEELNNSSTILQNKNENMIKREKELKDNIQKLLEQNENKNTQINNLDSQIISKDNEIKYLNDQIKIRDNQINNLNIQINKMNNQIGLLNIKNNELNLYCGQYQLMIQNLMSNNLICNNQINNLINASKMININNINNNNIINHQQFFTNNNMNNINNNQNNNTIKTLIFKFENGRKCTTLANESCKLKDLYSIVFAQINNDEYYNINNMKFLYNTNNITKHFLNNDFVKCLNLPDLSTIDVIK